MFAAALVIYIILSLVLGPFWPLALLGGKMGWMGYAIVGGWVALLIGGAN